MAAAVASNNLVRNLVMSNASNGPFATILATGDERMRRIGRFLDMSYPRKPLQSSGLTIANWSGVVVRGGECVRGPLASLPTTCVPTFQEDPTPAIKDFPFRNFSKKMPDSLQFPAESVEQDRARRARNT